VSGVPPRLEVTTPAPTDIVLVRELAAPAARVFDALTRPDLLVRWYGAQGWNLVACEVDLRVGGVWRFVSRGPHGATMAQSGTYLEVERPHRLVQTEASGGAGGDPTVVATVLTERDGRTTLRTTIRYPDRAARDAAVESPMAIGAGQSYARLDGVLAAPPGASPSTGGVTP
jgi:uncharacterized protein YndB with AHSA1/START domain